MDQDRRTSARRERTSSARGGRDHKNGGTAMWPGAKYIRYALFPLVLLYGEIFLRVFAKQKVFRNFGAVFFFAVGAGLFFTALTTVWKKKVNRILTAVFLGLNCFLFTLECLIRNAYKTYMTVGNVLSGAGNVAGKYAGEMWKAIFLGIPKMLVFMLPFIVYMIWGRKHLPAKRKPLIFSGAFLLAAFVIFGLTALFAQAGKYKAVYGQQYTYDNAVSTFGLTCGNRLSIKYAIFGKKAASFHGGDAAPSPAPTATPDVSSSGEEAAQDPLATPTPEPTPTLGPNVMDLDFEKADANGTVSTQSLSRYIQSLTPTMKNQYTGLFKGKNLIMICAEAFCGAFVDPQLTPTLYRLIHNGFYLSQYYLPSWGGSTTTGEVAFTTSLAANHGDDSMIRIQDHNLYFTLGNMLQREGYSSIAFHNGAYDYYSRNETHENLGYNQFLANETGLGALMGEHYAPDSIMMESTIDLYIDHQPFSVYYMTITGHAPYVRDKAPVEKYYDRVNSVVGDKYLETTKYYICYQMELEEALRVLVERLEAAGIEDNTVIMMTGDHYPYGLTKSDAWGNDQDYLVDLLGHNDWDYWDRDENSAIIWCGSLEHGDRSYWKEIPEACSTPDLLPTALNLFGLEFDSRLLLGRDLLAEGTEELVFWDNLSWVTERGKYDSYEEIYYPNEGYTDDREYRARIDELVADKLLMSHTILDEDYYYLLFGEDDVTFAGDKLYEDD